MTILKLGPVIVDLSEGTVRRGGEAVPLANKEAEILIYLASRPNQDVTREELYLRVWGYQPGVVSRTLDTTVHRLRSKIEANPSDPQYLRTVHGFGYRLVRPSIDTHRAPQGAPLRGRDRELQELEQVRGPLLVHGPPGVGKTALLSVFARSCEAEWIDAAGVAPEQVAALIASALGSTVVCDGLDEVPRIVAEAVASQSARVILGAMSADGWGGARRRLWPLPAEAARAVLEDQLAPELQIDGDALVGLAEVVDRIPGALMAISSSIPVIGARTLTERLPTNAAELDGVLCQMLQVRLAAAWELLDPQDRDVLVVTATFGREAPLAGLEALLQPTLPGLLSRVTSLFDRGWLAPTSREGRLRLYWHLRVCVLRLADPDSLARACTLHTQWAEGQASAVLEHVDKDPDLVEFPHLLRDLVQWWERASDPSDSALLAIDRLFWCCGRSSEHLAYIGQALTRPLSVEVEATLRVSRARIGLNNVDPAVEQDVDRVIELVGPAHVLGQYALISCALLRQYLGRTEGSDEARTMATQMAGDDPALQAVASLGDGMVWSARGEMVLAERSFRTCHELAVRAGDLRLAREALVKLAVALTQLLRLDGARAVLRQARRQVAERGIGRFGAGVAMLEGQLAAMSSDLEGAARAYVRARDATHAMDLHGGAAAAETNLAWVHLARGDLDAALQLLMSSLDRWPLHRNPDRLGNTRGALATTYLLLGEVDAAVELYRETVADCSDPGHEAMARALLAVALHQRGSREAAPALESARSVLMTHEDPVSSSVVEVAAWLVSGAHGVAPDVVEPYRAVFGMLANLLQRSARLEVG